MGYIVLEGETGGGRGAAGDTGYGEMVARILSQRANGR